MTLPANAHTHTTHSDGRHTPREMAEQALALGMTALGFSDHSPAPFDPTCPGVRDEAAYRSEIAALKEEYAGRLDILCGIEQDFYGPIDRAAYDYIIGSVHYMPVRDGKYNAADGDTEVLRTTREKHYNGDGLAMARDFYDLSVENARRYKPDIIGHFDVLAKLNESVHLFDEQGKPYRDMALAAIDEVCNIIKPYGGIFEMNTGGISRGYRSVPYPTDFLLRHLAQRGARLMISSDSHERETLDYGFAQCLALARQAGFTQLALLQNGRFEDVPLPG